MTNPSIQHGDVRRAIDRLARRNPLLAGVLSSWRIVESRSCKTMGVGMPENRLTLLFNPDFVAACTADELAGVLCHECYHVILGHIFHRPAADENRTARTIAQEVTVNEWVDLPLPGKPILLRDFPFLPELEDTETRYERLCREDLPEEDMPDTLDDHEQWADAADAPDWVKAAVAKQVQTVLATLSPEARRLVPAVLVDLVENEALLAGLCAVELPAAGPPKIAWQQVLRRYVGQLRERRPVFGRPPRRFPNMAGILPAHARRSGKLKVMAVIDTSGSLEDATLAAISSELRAMAKIAEVHVVECDDTIHRVYRYSAPLKHVVGRGNTDLRPPFDPAFLKQHRPDAVLYFTDGQGPAPESAPPMPVCWVLVAGGEKPCGWGREIWMEGGPAAANSGTTRP